MNSDDISPYQRQIDRGNFSEALAICHAAIERNPSDWNAIYMAGIALRFRGEFEKAITYYQNALALEPNAAFVWHALGIAYQQKGDHSNAITAFERAINLEEHYHAAYNSLALTHKLKGDYANALNAFNRALEAFEGQVAAAIKEEHPEYFIMRDIAGKPTPHVHRAFKAALRQQLVTSFDYANILRNTISCCNEWTRQLQSRLDACTPIDPDISGPF